MLAILMENVAGGLVAGVITTFAIVIFGEIIPQSVCSRYGLMIGYYTRYLVYLFMLLTGVISWPAAKILDVVLGEELSTWSKRQLKAFISIEREEGLLSGREAGLLMGALELHDQKVFSLMVPLEEVKMLSDQTVLDFKAVHGKAWHDMCTHCRRII
jgi:metal transporter CNNM